MRTIFFLLTATLLQVHATSIAQVSLHENNITLRAAIKSIARQTGYDFVYADKDLRMAKPIRVALDNATMEQALAVCFEGQPLTYAIADHTVLVRRKEPANQPAVGIHPPEERLVRAYPEVRGRVVDSVGNPLAGASVRVLNIEGKRTTLQTKTDEHGYFELNNVPEGYQLEISYIGHVATTIVAAANVSTVVLKVFHSELEEVEVMVNTGYQTLPKERVTGSFAKPDQALYENRVSTDMVSKLEGITSGLVFNRNTLAVANRELDINIRGRSTLFADDQPLIIVDNFPYSGNILDLNPNDIADITVLKDAAASSIWGARSGNGVVVVTSKTGRLNQPLKLTVTSNVTIVDKPNLQYNPDYFRSTDYVDAEIYLYNQGKYNDLFSNDIQYPIISPVVKILASGATADEKERAISLYRNSDVRDDMLTFFYRNAIRQQHALSVSGGGNKASYYVSGGFDRNLESIKDNDYSRITLNSQQRFFPTANLEIQTGINIIHTATAQDHTLGNTQLNSGFYPYTRFADESGTPLPIDRQYDSRFIDSISGMGFLDWSYYPLKEQGTIDWTTTHWDVRANTGLSYKFWKGLEVWAKYQYQRNMGQTRILSDISSYDTRRQINSFSIVENGQVVGYNMPLGDILSRTNSVLHSHHFRTQLGYAFEKELHEVTALAGVEVSATNSEGYSQIMYGYNDDVGTFTNANYLAQFPLYPNGYGSIPSGLGATGTADRFRSWFGNAAYTYRKRYTLSISGRTDASNYFGVQANQRVLPLWSSGLLWQLSKEDFYDLAWLPELKIRMTYGYNGNLDRSVTGITTFRYYANNSRINLPYADISNLGNPELRWEKSRMINWAIDFATKNHRLFGSLEYYDRRGTDMIGDKIMPTTSGVSSFRGNYSTIRGNGVDIQLTSENLTGILRWRTTFLFSYTNDRVVRYESSLLSGAQYMNDVSNVPLEGKPVYPLFSFRWAGLNPETGDPQGYLADGSVSSDYQNMRSVSVDNLVYHGRQRPAAFGGLTNRWTYKGFELAVQLSYKAGYYFRRPALSYGSMSTYDYIRGHNDYVNRWQNPGDEQLTDVPSLVYPANSDRDLFYAQSEVNVLKGDHIRIQDVYFGYTFKPRAALPLRDLHCFFYTNNLGILWRANKQGYDPDYVPSSGGVSTLPPPRTFALGVKASF
ncbi:SusC/RagA family TonB-linked outer membrane protein [Parapedobacter pyrenivorans]|uniref:SusC/RagA family TonB-linked outer membrane protein n=2 Tax=Parapedobacter pyrenivorans TaxID=1305674 RepID=A0A917ME85_9SPHI|nr:SusC/RagA family TonB-linked outer membrane protein [Parapedobacter pyrenivorans]